MKLELLPLKQKPEAAKCNDHRTFFLTAHTVQVVAMILGRRIERKIENLLGEDQWI
jgi:hypothetical protein